MNYHWICIAGPCLIKGLGPHNEDRTFNRNIANIVTVHPENEQLGAVSIEKSSDGFIVTVQPHSLRATPDSRPYVTRISGYFVSSYG